MVSMSWYLEQSKGQAAVCSLREGGWAGISMDSADWTKCAVARAFPRDVALLSAGRTERMFYFPQNPTDLQFNQSNMACLLVANGPEVISSCTQELLRDYIPLFYLWQAHLCKLLAMLLLLLLHFFGL